MMSWFNWLKENTDFDQLIWEFGTDDAPSWIHISIHRTPQTNPKSSKAKWQNQIPPLSMIGSMTWKKSPLLRYARLIIPSVILAVVSGCGIAKPHQESVVVKDTVVVTKERILHDTLTIQKDTILYQDRVKVEIRYLEGETMVVTAECPSDTVTITQVKIVQSKESKSKFSWEGLLGWTIAILCLLVIIRTVIQKLI
jgi:hypothetical protein